MIHLLLKLLGVKMDAAQQVTSASLQLRNGSWLGWAVFGGILLGLYSWWIYNRHPAHRGLPAWRRVVLTALRAALFVLLVLILLRPVVSFTVENRLRQALVILIDKSASMDIRDPRREGADIKRAQIVLGDSAASRNPSRSELVSAALGKEPLDLLTALRKHYDVEFSTFDRDVSAATEAQALTPTPPDDAARQATAIGDAVRDVLNRKRGQPVAGIVLATDGGNNSGSEPLDAAADAGEEKKPLYIYGVGITSPRDIIVDSLFTPEIAFVKDEAQATVHIRAQGLEGQTGRLSLKLGNDEVASREIDFSQPDQTVTLNFTPQKAGDLELTASIPPRADEAVKDNNSASQRLRVIDGRIKVLYVEQTPRWEFRFIQAALLRDRRVDAKFLLLPGDPALAAAADSPYIASFPSREDLFKYDLVIIGDAPAAEFSQPQMEGLTEFVSKFGGAVIFIAGKEGDPSTYAGTPLAKLLPVEFDVSTSGQFSNDRPTTLALTAAGSASPMLKFSSDERENERIWHSLPPIQWIYRVTRAKPGAQVLAEDTDPAKITRFGRMPAIALQQYGVGQVLFIATDNTWRWRQDTGVSRYPVFWGQIVERMALAHLLGASRRTQLSVDKQHYNADDRVTVLCRLYDENFDPVTRPSVNALYTIQAAGAAAASSPQQTVELHPLPEQPGMYRGDFVAVTPGAYKLSAEGDPSTVVNFSVEKPRFESGDTAMNEPLLREMARASHGVFFREEDLATLPDRLSEKDERIDRVVDAELWASPFYFLLVAGIVILEWILRKRSELK